VYPKNKYVSCSIYIRLNSVCSNRWSPFLCFISCPCPLQFYYTFVTLLHDVSQFPFSNLFPHPPYLLQSTHGFISSIRFPYISYSIPLPPLYTLSFLHSVPYSTLTQSVTPDFCSEAKKSLGKKGGGFTVGVCARSQSDWLQEFGLYGSFDVLAGMMTCPATTDSVPFCPAGHKVSFYIS
jgi:hypothetical protein